MKLTSTDIEHLSVILSTASLGGVESMIIEDGKVRGMNEARTFVILSDYNVPKLSQKIGLSRLNTLRSRLNLLAGADMTIDARETERGEIASLDISAGRSKVQYRCTATALIKAPRSINDEPLHVVTFEKDELKLILDALKVMSAKAVQLIIKKSGLTSVRASDETNDAFETALSSPAELLSEADSVVHSYSADIFHAVLRALGQTQVQLIIGVGGTIRTIIEGHEVVIMPKVGEEEEDS